MKNSAPLLTALPRKETGGPNVRPILAKDGYNCALITLTGDETLTLTPEQTRQDHLLFVAEGSVQVENDGIVSLLGAHEALRIARGQKATLRNPGLSKSVVLRVDVPPPLEREPLYTFPGKA